VVWLFYTELPESGLKMALLLDLFCSFSVSFTCIHLNSAFFSRWSVAALNFPVIVGAHQPLTLFFANMQVPCLFFNL
jgi:hypothetical protein